MWKTFMEILYVKEGQDRVFYIFQNTKEKQIWYLCSVDRFLLTEYIHIRFMIEIQLLVFLKYSYIWWHLLVLNI